ncbi:hypothetical protein, partial [Legionella sp.]|uniref:hypothetical protein n=1 Tax=Legionella sp. TaxID=459 RepID=UPI00257B332D
SSRASGCSGARSAVSTPWCLQSPLRVLKDRPFECLRTGLRDVAGAPPQAERFSKTLDLARNIIKKKVKIPQVFDPLSPDYYVVLGRLRLYKRIKWTSCNLTVCKELRINKLDIYGAAMYILIFLILKCNY